MRIAVFGDSISQGIGSKKYNYCSRLKQNIEMKTNMICDIKNFALTGTTIYYANQIVDQVLEYRPNVVLSFYGNVDAMIRPKVTGKPNVYALIPKRYKKNGMLDPRPFFSSNKRRRFIEHIDSFIRYNLKKILICLQGTYCWVEIEDFISEYQRFLNKMKDNNCIVFVISTVVVDDFYFPGTPENYKRFNHKLMELCDNNNTHFIDIYSILNRFKWDDVYCTDHFHLNSNGYDLLAEIFADVILNQAVSKGIILTESPVCLRR